MSMSGINCISSNNTEKECLAEILLTAQPLKLPLGFTIEAVPKNCLKICVLIFLLFNEMPGLTNVLLVLGHCEASVPRPYIYEEPFLCV